MIERTWNKPPKKRNVTTAITDNQFSTMKELCVEHKVNISSLLKMGIHLVALKPELAKELATKYQRVEEF